MMGYDRKQLRGVFGLSKIPLIRRDVEKISGDFAVRVLDNAVSYGDATKERGGETHWEDKFLPTDPFLEDWERAIEETIAEDKKYLKNVRKLRKRLSRIGRPR